VDAGNPNINTIVVEGLKPLSTVKTKQIVESQLDDLKAAIYQDELAVKAISGSTTAETITQHIIPKVIREKYPELSEEEVEEVRQHLLLDMIVKGNDIVDSQGKPIDFNNTGNGSDGEQESEGNRLLKLTNRFINLDKLSINLIDTINPFQRAYEVISKSVDAPTLKIIQDTIAEQKFDMPIELAIKLFKGPLKEWIAEHDGMQPSLTASNAQERELAQAFTIIKNLKIRKMMGLDYNPNEK
jgi:hypothetical protein